MAKNIDYNPDVIQSFANKLYTQAKQLFLSYALGGILVGLLGGYFLGRVTSPGNELLIAMVCAILLCFISLSSARAKAFALKLQAQQALCQIAIEKNTRKDA
ncbi:hypothetical protein [Geminisphaera colitermitum]|uniref:hypothetical protein n=1 Tax=Geminisphaera colitermitum TaxID=1148786 RepID=UPI0012FE7FDB|nr:hypothetical protein [Geminisphaera colitermitum]